MDEENNNLNLEARGQAASGCALIAFVLFGLPFLFVGAIIIGAVVEAIIP